MKTKIKLLLIALITTSAFSQKNELKIAEKAIKSQDYTKAITAITDAESLITNMDNKSIVKFYFLKAQAYNGKKDFQTAANALDELLKIENQTGKKKYSNQAITIKNEMVQELYQTAISQYRAKDYKNASSNFYIIYKLSPQDTTSVYNAATSSTLAKEYDLSLKYYRELQRIKYTGISTVYYATNKTTDVKENLGTKENRDLQVKIGLYKDPVDEKTKSKTGDIIKNIADILRVQGKTEEALKAVEEARNIYPNDINLILTQGELYLQLKQMDKFAESMELAIKLDPTDPRLFFNLGVISFNRGNIEEAKKNYLKAIELKEDYAAAYINLASVILDKEKAIIDEMNENLSDFDKYDQLLLEQKEVYKEALPYLEKADKYNRTINTVQNLMNLYQTLEMEEKANTYTNLYRDLRDQ
ncbi:MAG: Beta-barrel assembly-enhancing protease [Flavobacterium sp. SCGC AAA160-P02]|nr:MAG: Beta-barrel assembly-enhancing protease [Flavobacterium sp. SCGC AAA160-P02]